MRILVVDDDRQLCTDQFPTIINKIFKENRKRTW